MTESVESPKNCCADLPQKKQKWVCRESKFGMEGAKARKIARFWVKHRPKRVCWARKGCFAGGPAPDSWVCPGPSEAFGRPLEDLGESEMARA